jgi:oligopeptide/dipeptide ABC transporter ATP-binding protein
MIAMSLACEPALLFADEPTTALDLTILALMLDLMNDLRAKIRTAIILITHDLGVGSEVCARILVMYGGQVMEEAASEDLFATPLHPYTVGLLRAFPGYSRRGNAEHRRCRFRYAAGPAASSPGCPFVERCPGAAPSVGSARPVSPVLGGAPRRLLAPRLGSARIRPGDGSSPPGKVAPSPEKEAVR